MKSLGAFPISRGTGGAQGIQTAIDLLEEEKVVCMFPEGTRSKTGELLNPKMGMVMLAYKTHCTILPVAIVGEGGKPPKVFKKMVINIGKPIRFEDMGLTEDSGMIYRRVSRNILPRCRSCVRKVSILWRTGGRKYDPRGENSGILLWCEPRGGDRLQIA